MFASVHDVNYYAELTKNGYLEKKKRARKPLPASRDILNALCAFDIETTRIDLPIIDNRTQNSHAFMYVWQFQINDITIMGRTWDEAKELFVCLHDTCKRLEKEYKLSNIPILVIWVHNLAYEFQFLSGIYDFKNEECFFRDIRKPIYCKMFDCLEFRCSYLQTNMSLFHLTKQLGVKAKLSGQKYDYNKIRFPWTELTEYEKEYCATDVQSLVECMRVKMQNDGDNLQSIPLTSTGYVRRDCKEALKPVYLDIKEMLPDEEQYRLLRRAFRGGNTHANRKYSTKIINNVFSYDMSSCYPAQQLTRKFPMSRFRWIDDRLNFERIKRFIDLGYAVVGLYQFKRLRLRKEVTIPYISLARTEAIEFRLDNGRVLEAEYIEMALTEIDLKIILKQYTFDEIQIKTAMVAQKHYLPEEYRNVIIKYYQNKTMLKGSLDSEQIYLYQKSKEKLNGIYGMSAQDPIHAEILYNGGEYTRSDYNSIDVKKVLSSAKFPYQWGVYTTAYARAALQDAIDIACNKMIYCDTDSVKTLGKINIDELNKKRQTIAEKQMAFADDIKGTRHYMGVFELECMYDRFVTCGSKRYAFEIDGKMSVTVSGVSKAVNEKSGIPFAVEELGCLENFHEGFIWRKSAGTMAVYNDDDFFEHIDVDTGKSVVITKNVAIIPTTYEMTYAKDYKQLLSEIELYGEYKRKRE